MPEASFNHAGERGRMDLVAFHPPLGIVLVVEVKTVIADLQDLLGRLDAKRRAALGVARDRGWRANEVRSALVLLKSSTNRRRVAEHEALFRLFSVRGNEARRWIRAPAGGASPPGGGLLLFQSSNTKLVGARRAGRQRVRRS